MLLLGRPLPTDSLGGAPFGGQLQRRRLQHIVRAQLRVHPNREEEAALQPSVAKHVATVSRMCMVCGLPTNSGIELATRGQSAQAT